MRRPLIYLAGVLLVIAACSNEAEPTTTSTAPTTTSTTTTTAPTTTTTVPPPTIEIDNAGAKLRTLVRDLYEVASGGADPAAPPGVLTEFAKAEGKPPLQGSAALALSLIHISEP